MATTLTEGQHRGEFIVSEANGYRSRESVTIASGETLVPGTVLGFTGSEYKTYDPNNADGSQTAVAISFDHVDATGGAVSAPIIARDAEVNDAELVWFSGATAGQKTTGLGELEAQSGIVAR